MQRLVLHCLYTGRGLPWVALVLRFRFGLYGLVRKHVNANTFVTLFIETAILTPFAVGYWIYLASNNQSSFTGGDSRTALALIFLGPLTIGPLAIFSADGYVTRRATQLSPAT